MIRIRSVLIMIGLKEDLDEGDWEQLLTIMIVVIRICSMITMMIVIIMNLTDDICDEYDKL